MHLFFGSEEVQQYIVLICSEQSNWFRQLNFSSFKLMIFKSYWQYSIRNHCNFLAQPFSTNVLPTWESIESPHFPHSCLLHKRWSKVSKKAHSAYLFNKERKYEESHGRVSRVLMKMFYNFSGPVKNMRSDSSQLHLNLFLTLFDEDQSDFFSLHFLLRRIFPFFGPMIFPLMYNQIKCLCLLCKVENYTQKNRLINIVVQCSFTDYGKS